MGSALLNPPAQASPELAHSPASSQSSEELRQQVAARLAAHRERRMHKNAPPDHIASSAASAHEPRKSRIAATVAERYANAQSYRAFLAAEAERAVQQARAAAEIAARNARAVAEVQARLLNDLAEQAARVPAGGSLGQFTGPASEASLAQPFLPDLDLPPHPAGTRTGSASAVGISPPLSPSGSAPTPMRDAPATHPPLRVVLFDDVPAASLSPTLAAATQPRRDSFNRYLNDPEALALDDEISFRREPVFEEPAGPPMPLPANLIEFPRQLVAARKARPRYAEGPLRDEDRGTKSKEQLRIFEVDSAQISTQPESAPHTPTPEPQWTSLWLDAPTGRPAPAEPAAIIEGIPAATNVFGEPKLYPAKLSRRVLAGSIDLGITALAGAACAAAFSMTASFLAGQSPFSIATLRALASNLVHTVPGSTLGLSAIAALLLLSVAMQAVCFTFSDSTPGMRAARIGLCTFSDNNPTRTAMRLRVFALVLSTAVMGLGFLWATFDEDHLTWHDLISRMYQRSY